jgi:hypothetical protein
MRNVVGLSPPVGRNLSTIGRRKRLVPLQGNVRRGTHYDRDGSENGIDGQFLWRVRMRLSSEQLCDKSERIEPSSLGPNATHTPASEWLQDRTWN